MRTRKPYPSPALIVAAIALVFAMAATALAGPSGISKITKSKVKSIAGNVVENEAPGIARDQIQQSAPGLTVQNAATAANATNADTLGGKAPGEYMDRQNVLSAEVTPADQNAALVAGSGRQVEGVHYIGNGAFTVDFAHNITNCVATANSGTMNSTSANSITAEIYRPASASVFTVGVTLTDNTGALVNDARGFSLIVVCPPIQ